MTKPKTITSWSPSRLATYNQCPRKAKYKFVDKMREESGPAAQRGTDIHDTLEAFVQGTEKSYHAAIKPTYKNVKGVLTRLRKGFKAGLVTVEQEVAVDVEWRPTEYAYDNPDVWARFKLDVLENAGKGVCRVIDWKSGKLREGGAYDDQVNAYAVAVLSVTEYERAVAVLAFVDHDVVLERPAGAVARHSLKLQQDKWTRAVGPMFRDTTFRPHPSTLCKWCAFSKAKGGPCDF